jgi:hypothetical protein
MVLFRLGYSLKGRLGMKENGHRDAGKDEVDVGLARDRRDHKSEQKEVNWVDCGSAPTQERRRFPAHPPLRAGSVWIFSGLCAVRDLVFRGKTFRPHTKLSRYEDVP